MLVNCPKCGFSQPNDQYCAQCGVDMATYRPAKPGLIKRALKSPFTYVVLAVCLIGIAFLYVQDSQRRELSERIEYLQSGPLIVESSQENISVESAPESNETTITPSSSSSSGAVGTEAYQKGIVEEEAGNSSTSTTLQASSLSSVNNESPAAIGRPKFVKVVFAEIGKNYLKRIQEDLKKYGAYQRLEPDLFWGLFKSGQFELTDSPEIRILDTAEFNLSASIEWHKNLIRDSDNDPTGPGFNGAITQISTTDQMVKLDSEIIHINRGPDGALQRRSFPYVFEAKSNDIYILSGILPNLPTADPNLIETSGPFQIYSSEKFQRNESELTLFYIFHDTDEILGN